MQMGEYVALGKVEIALKILPIVESVCVYANPSQTASVALIVPDEAKLRDMAAKMERPLDDTVKREILCQDKAIRGQVLKDIGLQMKATLENFEIPKAVRLIAEPWTPENGLLTSAMKIKRKPIQKSYQSEIDDMYEEIKANRSKGNR